MNKQQKEELSSIINSLKDLHSRLNNLFETEEEKRNNFPENLLCSQRGEDLQRNVDYLYVECDNIDNAIKNLSALID